MPPTSVLLMGASLMEKLKSVFDEDKRGLPACFQFHLPQKDFMRMFKSRVSNVARNKFETSRGELCSLVYPLHILPKDNSALSSQHNASIAKLCSQVSRAASVCLDETPALQEQSFVELLKSVCTADITRRLVEQVKRNILGPKPDPAHASPTNLALGRFDKALGQVQKKHDLLEDCVWCCLRNLPTPVEDLDTKKAQVMETIANWWELLKELSVCGSDFIKCSVTRSMMC